MFTRACLLLTLLASVSACSDRQSASAETSNVASYEAVQWDAITAPSSLSRVYNSNLVQQR